MTISEKVAYLKGLADGLELDKESSKEGKLLGKIIDILEDLGFAVEDLEVEVEAIADEMDTMAEDLSDVESLVFDEWEDEDCEDCGSCCCASALDDDDFFEIACPSCGEDIVIDESVLDIGEVTCPNCGDKFSLDLVDEAEEEEKGEE
ncbi:MAG TPA: zinc-ribbon domain-containing protein [Candidatus Evtepia faecigallinarum]|nr:zinc-ribbon domain-containing protein [Candidatus Evtepia faecigallinarum]